MKYSILLIVVAVLLLSAVRIPVSHAPIDEKPIVKINDDLVGIWKMREDTNYHDYFVVEKITENTYGVSYMNRGGDNRGYEHFGMYISEVGNAKFLNLAYRDFFSDKPEKGYVLLKIISLDHNGFELTAVTVSDFMLNGITESVEVRKRIETNMNNPSFYGDTVHFRKKLPLNVWK